MPTKTATKVTAKPRHSPMEHPGHQYPRETEVLQEILQTCGLTEKTLLHACPSCL